MEELTAAQIVGRRVRGIREGRYRITQAQLGQEVARYTGKAWSEATVSLLESGHRKFAVDELMILAAVLRLPVSDLLMPQGDELLVLGKVRVAHDWHLKMVLPRDAADLATRLQLAREALEDTPIDDMSRRFRGSQADQAEPTQTLRIDVVSREDE